MWCFVEVFGETQCAERGFRVVKRGEVVVETWLETAVKSWRKMRQLFYIFKTFFAQLLSGRLPDTGAFGAVTFRIDIHLND